MENLTVKLIEQTLQLGQGWEISSAGGATGEAYIAQFEGNKLFLKRNSSPFLAVLSAEGIVPKLVWTKRMGNGDVISAQHWLEGRELKPEDMKQPSVAKLLSKIHHSTALLDMLKRINKTPLHPLEILVEIKSKLESFEPRDVDTLIHETLKYLESNLPSSEIENQVVCHCDVNHNNWLLSRKNNQLYLIDWDGARIADPALDLGLLLYWYIPKQNWNDWLLEYGMELTASLENRMKWYVISQTVLTILLHKEKEEVGKLKYWLTYLDQILNSY